jgi:20S proteasome alpha/beta subunit
MLTRIIFTQATAGLLADGRHLAGRARDEAESYRDTYHTRISTQVPRVILPPASM